ncbi:unnamed protein product, partial [Amoebophrya sp. A120]
GKWRRGGSEFSSEIESRRYGAVFCLVSRRVWGLVCFAGFPGLPFLGSERGSKTRPKRGQNHHHSTAIQFPRKISSPARNARKLKALGAKTRQVDSRWEAVDGVGCLARFGKGVHLPRYRVFICSAWRPWVGRSMAPEVLA